MFNEEEKKFIDNLLQRASIGDFRYSRIQSQSEFDFELYDRLFVMVNKPPYYFFDSDGDGIWLTTLGKEVLMLGGVDKYLESKNKDKDLEGALKEWTLKELQSNEPRYKTTRNISYWSLGISILALITAIFFGILDNIKTNKTENNKESPSNPINNQTQNNNSVDTIQSIPIKVISDTTNNIPIYNK